MNHSKLSVFLFLACYCNIGQVFAAGNYAANKMNKSLFYGSSSAAQNYRNELRRQALLNATQVTTQVSEVNENVPNNYAVQNQIALSNLVVSQQSQSIMSDFHVSASRAQELFIGKNGMPVQVIAIAAGVTAVSGLVYYTAKKSGILLTKQEKFKKLANELYVLQKDLNRAEAGLKTYPADLRVGKALEAKVAALKARKEVLKKAMAKLNY